MGRQRRIPSINDRGLERVGPRPVAGAPWKWPRKGENTAFIPKIPAYEEACFKVALEFLHDEA